MGFTLPSPASPAEHVRALMARKEVVEAELETNATILAANANSTLNSPLIDRDGFPRDDIDVYAVRNARVRIIELRNDLKDLMNEIGKALEGVYDPNIAAASSGTRVEDDKVSGSTRSEGEPFLKVQGVSPEGPAAEAVSFVYPFQSMPRDLNIFGRVCNEVTSYYGSEVIYGSISHLCRSLQS
jgi:26S proteasome regulatory subunit N4